MSLLFTVMISAILFTGTAAAENTLEVTSCKGNIATIISDYTGFQSVIQGGGTTPVRWEKIEKVVFICDDKYQPKEPIPCRIFLKNGERINSHLGYFIKQDIKKVSFSLGGENKLGPFSINRKEIKQIIVK